MRTTRVFNDILEAFTSGKRRIGLEGGTAAGKTWGALDALVIIAEKSHTPLLISVVSESLPHLRRGAIRDFFKILGEPEDDNQRWQKSTFTYSLGCSIIEFFGADDAGKVRGPRRDILFLNEGNNIPWETARGLDIRTSRFTIVDWNPVGEFWWHDNWAGAQENAYSHSTYLDARDVLPVAVVENIESNRDKDPNWWNIYGLGLVGKVEGLVYPKFDQVDALPAGYPITYGLDFGYLVDPSALVANVIVGDKLYSQELIYEAGLDNQQIARRMDLLKVPPTALILADPDEPKSIQEIQKAGFNIQEGVKGPGSVQYSHQKVNQFYQFWTKDSVNCIKEQRNFRYIRRRDSTGREYLSDDTTHQWSHGLSARRYGVSGYRAGSPLKVRVKVF